MNPIYSFLKITMAIWTSSGNDKKQHTAKTPVNLYVSHTRTLKYNAYIRNTSANLAALSLMNSCILIISTSQTMSKLRSNCFIAY